jgi:hypothetical protein
LTIDAESFDFTVAGTQGLTLQITGTRGERVAINMPTPTCEGVGSMLLAYAGSTARSWRG